MRLFQSMFFDRLVILFSIVTCILISACASGKRGNPNQWSAYEAAVAGKSGEARKLLKLETDDSFSVFLLACIELSDGNLGLSRRYADRFIATNPSVPDGKVLSELIEQRKAYPEESWLTSFAGAWKAAGSPQLDVSYFIDRFSVCENSANTEACGQWKIPEAFMGKPEELIAALELNLACNTEQYIQLCLSMTSADTPIPIKLLALSFLTSDVSQAGSRLSGDLSNRVQIRRREVIEGLSHQLPLDIAFPLIAFLDQRPAGRAFSLTDIAYIEDVVSRPRLAPSPEELYNDYLVRFTAVGSKNPFLIASSMALMVDSSLFFFELKKQVMATAETASPEVRHRLSEIMEKVGRAQIKHRSIVGMLLGFNALRFAAQIKNDKIMEERVNTLNQYSTRLMDARILYAVLSSRFWPIRPLMINATQMQMQNEIGIHQHFSDIDMPDDFLFLLKSP